MLNRTQNRLAGLKRIAHQGARRLSACVLAPLAATLFACAPVWAQEPIGVVAEAQDGFARLIFTFEDRRTLPEYEINDENGVLVVTFAEPVTTVLPDIAGVLPRDITVARFDPDGTSVRLGLARPLDLSVREAGESLFVDLLPSDWIGLPPSLPDDVVARLVERAEEEDALAEARRRAQLVEEFDPRLTIRVARLPTLTRIVFDWNVGTEAQFAEDGDTGRVGFDWPVAIDLHPLLSNRPELVQSARVETSDLGSTVLVETADNVEMRFYEETPSRYVLDLVGENAGEMGGEGQSLDVAALLARIGEEGPAGADVTAVAEEGAANAEGAQAPEAVVVAIAPVVSQIGHTVRIAFPFPTETAAAVFRRGDVVWTIFESPIIIEEPTRPDLLEGVIEEFDVVGAGASQVVRMRLADERLASLGTEGASWVLSLGDLMLNAAEPLVLDQRQNREGQAEITADLGRPGAVHSLRDPEVGDVLEVVTAFPPARAVVRDLEFVDFEAVQSIHGMVVRPKLTTVSVALEDSLAVISAADGLRLSPPVERRLAFTGMSEEPIMPLASLQAADIPTFSARRDALLARTGQTQGAALDHARLELATYFVGNRLGPEAIGVLDVLERDLRMDSLQPEIDLARASAEILSGHYDTAARLLAGDALGGRPEAMFWRAIARAETGNYSAARLDALSAMDVAEAYPEWARGQFFLAATRAAVEQQDMAMAQSMLTSIDVSNLDPEQVSRYELLSGRLDELGGRDREALESYGRVLAADIRSTTPEAVLRTISVLDRMGRLNLESAVDSLWVQSTLWRGDALEEDTLVMLADLQFRAGQYRNGFTTVRDMSLVLDASARMDSLQQMARDQFSALYLDGTADRLDPLDALAIYYDFRHLTPSGGDGDVMIRNLAQRLVSVDLLGQAAELLEYQVDQRLEGAARAQVATDLAIVHVANRQPDAALQALYRTRIEGLPPPLERQRRVLEARALIDSGREDLALDLLSSLSGRDADLLRVEALWQVERYREAAELIEILYGSEAIAGELSPVARMNVVKAAVGYVLAEDRIGLSRLRSKYAQAMASAPEWPMFTYVTDAVSSQSGAFVEIAREIAALDSLSGFLNAYREVYQPQDAIVPTGAEPVEAEPVPATTADAGTPA